ncbi:hypothetical protein BAUCODRAFT_436646 [Baudoinia panamericana UAMH 10762]|uniref:non-specific serine/threonine protein kinase n=1 Tax=Baudoinia panamericana (strain UAMH 10762) TaxID=717646 RepID=M2NCY9_BAUPA|nr:uncharacterized protein BAUCODRAFT_436646 [Baudoinia panamericana UAMH 10762]EMC97059.1 hypothetical protein BAUCODRAFT_436646 [Baudoinia panamericana UAMH 10762]
MGGPPGSQAAPLPVNLPFRLVSKTIGSGAYASVRRACPLNRSSPVIAVKFINKDHAFRAGRLRPKQLHLELSLHHIVSGHHNIVRYFSHGEDPAWVWLCLELAEGGDLFDKIEADEGCSEDVAHLYFTQLVNAIGWCHSKGVAHRDIKPENMLLSSDGDLKLADFGLATQFAVPGRSERKKCAMVCGSPPYIAPEILAVGHKNAKRKLQGEDKEGYDPDRSDVWSIAVVLFVLLAGNTPWDMPDAKQSFEFYDYIKTNSRPKDELWQKVPTEALSLLRGMLKVEPAERFMLPEVRTHPWFTRKNPEVTADGKVANPINLATQMMESLRINFDAQIPASQQPRSSDTMDIDPKSTLDPGWTKFASTQPETPVADTPFDWEAPTRTNAISASQPTRTDHDRQSTMSQLTQAELLGLLTEDPSMSQFSQLPIGSMTATQQARRFNDIAPSHSLARFISHFTMPHLLPLLVSALHRLNIPVATPAAAALEGREHTVSLRIKTTDARQQLLQGTIVVERIQIGGLSSYTQAEVLEVRFLKAKGDPLGWRRLFKQVAVLCKDALPRPVRSVESQM